MQGFSRLRDIDLQEQVDHLTKEIAALRKMSSKRGAALYSDSRATAHDLFEDVADRISEALPIARKRARAVEKAVHDNPTAAAAVGLVVLGLIATFVFSGRRE